MAESAFCTDCRNYTAVEDERCEICGAEIKTEDCGGCVECDEGCCVTLSELEQYKQDES